MKHDHPGWKCLFKNDLLNDSLYTALYTEKQKWHKASSILNGHHIEIIDYIIIISRLNDVYNFVSSIIL